MSPLGNRAQLAGCRLWCGLVESSQFTSGMVPQKSTRVKEKLTACG